MASKDPGKRGKGRATSSGRRSTSAAKGSASKKTSSRRRKPSATPPSRWRWVAAEVATWAGGLLLGLFIVSLVLWGRARQDVEAFVADPARALPGVVLSAPMLVRPGMQVDEQELAGELLAAGYEQVPSLTASNQFSWSDGWFNIRTARLEGPGFTVPESRVVVVIAEGRVLTVEPGPEALLRPTVLAVVGDPEERRQKVALEHVSSWLEPAVTAMEDQRFRRHPGVDPGGVLRALVHNLRNEQGTTHGGSTLTQQLAKNLFLTPDRTLQRKVREAFFALALETYLDKDRILELYLEEVYLGQAGGVPLYGVEHAARAWFGVSANQLELHQAATIAGVIAAPNTYSPMRHAERARARRDVVLERLVQTGDISREQADQAKAEPLVLGGALPGAVRRAPYAVDEAIDIAERVVGHGALALYGYRVHTSIQPLMQRMAERSVREGLVELEADYPRAEGAQAALVAVSVADGGVVALVGGSDYVQTPFNRATHAWREVGSTSKALLLLAALDHDPRLTPLTRFSDDPLVRTVGDDTWAPSNYDDQHFGDLPLRRVIEWSRNLPTVRLAEQVGFARSQQKLLEAGLTRTTPYPSMSLGAFPTTAWEMAGAFTVFPGGGTVRLPHLVVGISDAEGETLVVMPRQSRDLASPRATAIATDILQGVITDGTASRARTHGIQGAYGGKTGTTNRYRDAWFAGFSPDLSVAVYVGRDVGEPLGLAGSRAALPTWSRFMTAVGEPVGSLPAPEGLVRQRVCSESLWPARPQCDRTYSEIFAPGTVPRQRCDRHGPPAVEIGRALGALLGGGEREPDQSSVERRRAEEEGGRERNPLFRPRRNAAED